MKITSTDKQQGIEKDSFLKAIRGRLGKTNKHQQQAAASQIPVLQLVFNISIHIFFLTEDSWHGWQYQHYPVRPVRKIASFITTL